MQEEVKVVQLCPTLCNPMGYTVHGILQARILEYVAVSFSRRSSQPRDRTQVSHFADWTTRKAQEYWSGQTIPSPVDLLNPGIELGSPALQADSLPAEPVRKPTLCNCLDCSPPGSSVYGNSPGKNIGVGCHALLQGIFPTQGSNPGLPHCRQILYQLSHKGSPRILAWVACPFSSGSSQSRNRTRVSCIAGIFFTNWAIREALCCIKFC